MIGSALILKVLLCFLLALGLIGYANYLINVLQINLWLMPSIIISTIAAIVYIAGLVNIIPLAEYSFILLGIVLLIYYRKRMSFSPLKGNIVPGIMVLLLFVYVLWYNAGAIYPDGDTLNHWAWIVRSMVEDDRLPNFTNRIVYQSYPPATACWTYFGLKLIGYSESKALILQNLAIICYASTLFSFNKKRDIIGDVIVFLAMIPFVRDFDGLKVDIILAAATVAGFVVVSQIYKTSKQLFLLLIPFVITVAMIKNSGVLLAVYIIILAGIALSKNESKRVACKYCFSLGGITFGAWYLWQRHINMVYIAPTQSRHSMSLDYTESVIESRDSEYMLEIAKNFFHKWFTFNNSHEWLLFVVFIILSAIVVWKAKDRKTVLTVLLCFLIYYFVYKIGVLGVYLVNMPGEVLHMPSYERYHFTFSLIMIGVIVWIFFEYFYNSDVVTRTVKYCSGTVVAISVIFIAYCDQKDMFTRPDYAYGGTHRFMETLIKDPTNGLAYDDCVLGYHHDATNIVEDYVIYTTNNWASLGTDDPERVREALTTNEHGFDKVVVLADDEDVERVIRECGYGDSLESGVIELEKADKEEIDE